MKETKAAAKLSEIKSGEMKEVTVGETKVLLARVEDKCYAIAANCTHYGAPLAEGALVGDRIICPWHHACFHAATGDLEDPPALDALPNFPVRIEGDDVFVDLPVEPSDRRVPSMARPDAKADNRVFAILGAGAAGYTAAQTLREDGFKGRIVMISREDRLPYDRPNLSKDYLQGHAQPEWMPLRPSEFFIEHGIELIQGRDVASVNAADKSLTFDDGETIAFDSLLVATGGTPRRLELPGSNLKNIFVFRSFDDADAIIGSAEGAKNAVVVGASFIGMETASSLRQRGIEVTVVAPDSVPFEKTLGADIGRLFRKVHEDNGVRFKLETGVKEFRGSGAVSEVVLDSGEAVAAELVIAGVGVSPATGFLKGIDLHSDGGAIADKHLKIADGIYAAGDIAHFPDPRTGQSIRIEHWRTAMQQGRTAAHNMAGIRTAFIAVPFFWTNQFDLTLNYIGHTRGWDEIVIDGNVDERDFVAYYIREFRVLAVAGVNRDRELAYLEEQMRLNRMPSPDALSTVRSDAAHPAAV
jgi:NADPH-dependent 2,4-dienoyl-CoA reductase/sulfur reductase-like enzyme/nitrite reductase/ring-hydroxylating ferredoxin subunit